MKNYEIIDPHDVGIPTSSIILTARSGRAALKHHLERLGYSLSKEQLDETYNRFLELADTKKDIDDADLKALMGEKKVKEGIKINLIQVVCGTPLKPMATVTLTIDKKEYTAAANGNGPVDAALKAIDSIVKKEVILEEFLVQAITQGSDDHGKVHMQINYADRIYYGFGSDTDIVVASAKAYIDALNKVI